MKIFRALSLRRDEILFLALTGLYVGLCAAAAFAHGVGDEFRPLLYLNTGAVMTAGLACLYLLFLAGQAYYIMIFVRPPRLGAYLWVRLKSGPLNAERYRRALPIFIGLIFFLSSFTSMKQLIPLFQPFVWDETFLKLDRTLHFGTDAWRLLHPLFGYRLITWAVNLIYNLWLPALFTALYWQMLSLRDAEIRMRFFISFILCWGINGTFLAILFSSAGPCFYERLTGSDYFLPLMDYLGSVNDTLGLYAVKTQDMLWQAAQGENNMTGGGISAMPSVHVTTALLFLLTARALRLKIWPFFAAFFALIMIGSVHLGWHYAVDGYAAIATTLLIWRLSVPLVRLIH